MGTRKHDETPSTYQLFIIFASGILTGSFVFVPFFLLWTGLAGFITYTHYKNGFMEEGIAMYDIETPEDFEEKIRKLQRLREDGLITEKEFYGKREAIMREKGKLKGPASDPE